MKRFIALLLIMASGVMSQEPHNIPDVPQPVQEFTLDAFQAQLIEWYINDNKTYFKNKLPQYVVVWPLMDDRYAGLSWFATDSNTWNIGVNPRANPTFSEMHLTLLHEECHLKLDLKKVKEKDQHGPRWVSCMKDLSKKGAFIGIW